MASYHIALHPFDALGLQTKSMVGALLDYAGVDRQRFAQAWTASPAAIGGAKETVEEVSDDPKQEPTDAPRGVVLSGAAAVSAAGQIGITPQVVLSGAAAFSAAGQIGTRAEVITRVVNLLLQTVIVPGAKKDEGTLIEAVALPWFDIIALLERDPSIAYQLSWEKWEEMIAGTYKESGFDEVILTPRSGDHGRDVIAIMKGVGSIRVIDSVKAYRPPHLVGYDDVRALIGVLHGDGASKGFLTTTSDFAPNMMKDPLITRWIPSQLELVNGTMLLARLQELAQKRKL
jgi:restriction system protein